MNLVYRCIIVVQILYLAGCSGVSKADKARFTAVAASPVVLKEGAYAKPTFTTKNTANTVGLISGVTGGLIGGIAALAVVSTAEAVKQGNHKDATARLGQTAPTDIHTVLTRELQNQLVLRPFFAQRQAASGGATSWRIKVEITRYGLEKIASNSHSPVIYAQSWMEDPSGKRFIKTNHFGSLSTARASVDDYAADPALFRSHFDLVAKKLAEDICAGIEKAMSP